MLEIIEWIVALATLIATNGYAFTGFLVVCAIIVFTVKDTRRAKAYREAKAKQIAEQSKAKQT